jgi:hypothetical protein
LADETAGSFKACNRASFAPHADPVKNG